MVVASVCRHRANGEAFLDVVLSGPAVRRVLPAPSSGSPYLERPHCGRMSRSRHRSAFSVQHDLFDHQSGAVGLHDFPSAFHRAGVSEFPAPSPAIDAEDKKETVSDCGWSPGTQVKVSESMVGGAPCANSDFLAAALQSGTESQRIAKLVCEDERTGPCPPCERAGDEF
jgi:hypothetical protein